MKKFIFIITALFVVFSVLPASASYVYTFSSGDILDPNAYSYYGLGRIDFNQEFDFPEVSVIDTASRDRRALGLGSFTRGGKEYIYVTKSLKWGASTTNLVTDYSFYEPSVSISEPINAQERTLSLPYNTRASSDILLPPDEANGLIYAIDGNTLRAVDPLTWNDQATAQLDSGYTVHGLVSLWPDSHNYLYVWSSKRANMTASGDYTPISSDIHVYDRETLSEVAVFRHARTGFDTTSRRSDDEASFEVGRGLVFIRDGLVAYVAYDSAASRDAHASIWCIDEKAAVPTSTLTITSRDINGYDVDIESPMPDKLGGFYFVAVSGDINASTATNAISTALYHRKVSGELLSLDIQNVQSNGELVISNEGTYKGYIFAYTHQASSSGSDNDIIVYFWDGVTRSSARRVGTGAAGVEIEKPFYVDGTGFYFMMERKNEATQDEKDAVFFWNGTSDAMPIWESLNELEVEQPPLDGHGGFYFVNVDVTSPDASTLLSTMTLMHGSPTGSVRVCDLGSFYAPPSTFIPDPKDPQASPIEALQNEYALVVDEEHNQLFVGAGPVGGKFKMTVLDWTKKAYLESGDNVIIDFADDEMGGNANLGGMLKFTESGRYSVRGNNSGCDTGFGLLAFAGAVLFFSQKRRF